MSTYVRPRIPRAVSRRAVRNQLAFMGGATTMEVAPSRKTGRQKESLVNDAVKDWARIRNGVLYRNRRGMVELASGAKMPIGLGPNGTGDLIGYLPVTITADMIGQKVAVFTMIESKTETGRLADHQLARIEEVRDAGGISGCARHADDCEEIYKRWRISNVPF